MHVRMLVALLSLSVGLTQAAGAQEADERNEGETFARFELTPFVAYQFGGDFDAQQPGTAISQDADVQSHVAYALTFGIRADPQLQYEFLYSLQPTEIEVAEPALNGTGLDVEYLHFGGTAVFGESQYLKPYSVGSIGITRLSLDAPGAGDETPFSISLGVGMRVPVRPRFDIRLEGRLFLSFLEENSAVFCTSGVTGASCALRWSGSTFTQYTLFAGAAFAF